jgi:DNA replication protein DnaC
VERIGDTLSRLKILENISRVDTGGSSNAELDETPACPRCNDAGFLRADVPVGHADFGKVLPCTCRAAQIKQQRANRLRHLSNLGPLSRLTFDLLSPDGRQPEAGSRHRFRVALEQARRFARQPDGWLVFLGPPGSGKTHLAAAIVNERLSNGEPAVFSVVPDLLDHLRLTFSPQTEVSYDELFETVRTTGLLVLDDLGTHSSTSWAQEKLFQLLNHRYNAQLATIVTTNHRLDELDERLRSRLTDPQLATVCVVQDWEPSLLQQLGGLGLERLHSMTFESFSPQGMGLEPSHLESLRGALKLARDFAAEPLGWLVFVGLPGTGKTHLGAAIANALLAQGEAVCFVTVPDLLDYLRTAYAPDSKIRYERVFDAVRTAPVLVLDDLGSHSGTPWAQEKLFQLFNHRYNAKLPTIITTNLTLEDHDARLRSRMLDPSICTVFAIQAPPYRLESGGSQPVSGRPHRPRRTR